MKNVLLPLIVFLFSAPTFSQSAGPFRKVKMAATLAKPSQEKFQEDVLKKLKVPAGFKVKVFAKDLESPRMMVTDASGAVYVSRPKQGDILRLRDKNGDGVMDEKETFISGYDRPHGMAIDGDSLYFVALTKVFKANLKDGKQVQLLIDKLPNVGQHENRALAIGPDHKLYVMVASNCNSCVDPDKRMATMQRFNLDGTGAETLAEGLRDTIGFDWQPSTGTLYGMDHGRDWLGDDIPKEELNRIEAGKHYGWPFCWNEKHPDDHFIDEPENSTKKEFCKKSEAPVLMYTAHAAPLAMKFYTGKMFPAAYQGSAFVAMHGSWNRSVSSGYVVTRIIFKNGKPSKFEDFMTGFLSEDGKAQYGRPAGLVVLQDGSLLVSDDSAGVIYRVTYEGSAKKVTAYLSVPNISYF